MFTLYTSVGRFAIRENNQGERFPAVITHKVEHFLDIQEMIIWSSLMWNIMSVDELRPVFNRKEREAHVMSDLCCEDYLERLVRRGLVIAGRDVTGYEALYNLVKNLHVFPAISGFSLISFFKLIIFSRVPVRQAFSIFASDKRTADENTVMRIVGQEQLTAAELIMSIDKGVSSYNSHEMMLDTLYNDDKTTCFNIAVAARFCEKRQTVLQALVNLYLRKQILFERII